MRALLQRVRWAKVSVDAEVVGACGPGLLILLGVGKGDDEALCAALAKKSADLRIFADADGKMNKSLLDVRGQALVVSQFTLYADCTEGRRPFFGNAEAPERAKVLCERYVAALKDLGVDTATGRFGAMMQVELQNDGPVTILLDAAELGLKS